jgi:hypothetical protein
MARTFYKGERLGKTPACAICSGPGRGRRVRLELPHGVSVWLCADHRSDDFVTGRSGRDIVVSLRHVWAAAGCLTRQRELALSALLRNVRRRDTPPAGSYAWPELRAHMERRFAAGEPPRAVIDDVLRAAERHGARPPSVRTMQRWFNEGRWHRSTAAPDGDPSKPVRPRFPSGPVSTRHLPTSGTTTPASPQPRPDTAQPRRVSGVPGPAPDGAFTVTSKDARAPKGRPRCPSRRAPDDGHPP